MRQPKIFLADTLYSHTYQRGVARYFTKIVEAVSSEYGEQATIMSPFAANYGRARHLKPLYFRNRLGLNALIRDSVASAVTRAERTRIYYSPYFGNAKTVAAEVYTLYDMIYELFPHYYDRHDPMIMGFMAEKKRCVERAARVVAISENTAKDLLAYNHLVDPAKVVVIPLGVDEFFFEASKSVAILTRPYFLFVGHRSGYKNFLRLLQAFGQSGLSKEVNLLVVSPSATAWSLAELACLEAYDLQHSVQIITSPTDESVRRYYAGAIALVYPSEYEGFGLPVIEAMASGTLVLTSDRASIPEVAGHPAYYFDPGQVETIAEGLRHLFDLPHAEREARIAAGRLQARLYSWPQCQQRMLDLFRQLA